MNSIRQKISDLFALLDKGLINLAGRFSRGQLILVLVILPSVIAIALPLLFWGKPVFTFIPNSSDEIIYWREINSFVHYGFGGGQYSNDELPARFALSPYGTHGPAFAVVYGAIGKVFGWQEYSPVLIHLILLASALFVAVKIVNPGKKQLLVLILLFATWWPLQLYISSNMQEVLHSSAAIVVAALFYKFFVDKKNKLRYAIYISLLLVFLAPLRFIWSFLIFPLLIFFPERISLKSLALALFGTVSLLLAGAGFVYFFYSPSPWFWTTLLQTFQSSPRAGLSELWQHFLASTQNFIVLNKGLPLVVLLRYQVMGLMLAWGLFLIKYMKARGNKAQSDTSQIVFHFLNLGAVITFVWFFYDVLDTRDYRMLIGPLLLSMLLLVFSNKLKFVYPIIVVNLIFLSSFLSYYSYFRFANFNYAPQLVQETTEIVNSQLEFLPDTDRWCNTISVSKYGAYNSISYLLAGINSGFGITTILDWKEFRDRPLMAKYVLLDPNYTEPGFGNPVNRFDLVELTTTQLGALYLNPNSPCGK